LGNKTVNHSSAITIHQLAALTMRHK